MIEAAMRAIHESGSIIVQNWARPRTVTHKGAIDLVTETDVAVENFLKERLHDILPSAAFVAEESADSLEIPDGECWIIDPLDGTTNFVHHIPFVATSVALCRNRRVEFGMVNMPVLGECFYARRGMGAWNGNQCLHVSKAATLQDGVVATGFPYDVPRWQKQIMGWLDGVLPRAQGVRRMGAAAVDLAYVAAGRLDAFYEAALKPWDFAAGWLLVEEAGGKVSGIDGQPFDFSEDVIVASNGGLHGELLRALHANAPCARATA